MQEAFPFVEFFPSTLIFEENDLGDCAYILKEGRVEISMMKYGEKIILAELHPISIFGEMALLSKEKKRTATAKALGRVKAIKLDRTNFDQLLLDTPNIITAVLHGLTQRLVETNLKLHPGYVERRDNTSPPPPHLPHGAVDRRSASPRLIYDRIKIQLVHPEQKISNQPLKNYREVRFVTVTKADGVRVEYFDNDIEWIPLNTLVYVVNGFANN